MPVRSPAARLSLRSTSHTPTPRPYYTLRRQNEIASAGRRGKPSFHPARTKTLVSPSPCEALPGVHLLLRDRVSRRQRRALPPECHGHRGSARHQPHGGGGPSPCAVRIRRTRFPRHFLHAETAAALAVPFDRRTITVSLAPAFRVHADVAFRPSYLLTIMTTTSRVRLGTRD